MPQVGLTSQYQGGSRMTAIENEGGEGEGEAPRKKLSGKKIVMFIVVPLFLLVGGGAALYFTGILDSLLGKGKEEEHAEEPAHEEPKEKVVCSPTPVFFQGFPEVLVNLNTGERRSAFLKLKLSLEICRAEDQAALLAVMPRITDSFQVYLRELRTDDLKGTAGIYRLREELLMRINIAASPIVVKDVLVEEFLVQ
jgi:flagellar protein FliL